jgi:hypothetical protein
MGGSGTWLLVGMYRFTRVRIISIEPSGNVAVRGLDSGHRVVLVP